MKTLYPIRKISKERYHIRIIDGAYMSFRTWKDAVRFVKEVIRCRE